MTDQKKNLLPVLMTFCSACLGVLVPEDRMLLPRGTANIPLNWKLRCLPDHLITLILLGQQTKEEVAVLLWEGTVEKLDCFSTIEANKKSMSGYIRVFRRSIDIPVTYN